MYVYRLEALHSALISQFLLRMPSERSEAVVRMALHSSKLERHVLDYSKSSAILPYHVSSLTPLALLRCSGLALSYYNDRSEMFGTRHGE